MQSYLSNPKPEHTTGGSGRGGARRGGWAGHRVEQDAERTILPGYNRPSCLPGNRRQLSRTSLRKHEQAQAYGGTKPAVDPRFMTGTTPAIRFWLLITVPSPTILCKPFSYKAYSEIRVQTAYPLIFNSGLSSSIGLRSYSFVRASEISSQHFVLSSRRLERRLCYRRLSRECFS